MEIAGENEDGVLKVLLKGRMDVEGVATINDEFSRMMDADGLAVVVDMSEVPYMSSIGIRALLINAKTVSRRGGKYVLLSPQADVRNVLQVSGIDQIIVICDSLEDARSRVLPE